MIFFAKLVRQWKLKEWAKFELECLLLIFIYSNSNFKVTSKNGNFECWYLRTHTEEKLSKTSNITFAILSSYQKKKTLNRMPVLSTFESITLDETIRSASKWLIWTWKTQNLELLNLRCVTYAQPIPVSLTAHNWQKWKGSFLVPAIKIYREEAVGLERFNYTLKIIFGNVWNLDWNIFIEIFHQYLLSLNSNLTILLHKCDTYYCDYLPHTTFCFYLINVQLRGHNWVHFAHTL